MKQKKTVEDYLKTIYILQCRNGIVRGSDIAQEQNVSRPTVSIALKDLEQEGYLFTDEAHEIHLTKIGQKIAEATYERHQTLQNLLIKLGVDQQTAAADACKMEHVISDQSFPKLKEQKEKNRLLLNLFTAYVVKSVEGKRTTEIQNAISRLVKGKTVLIIVTNVYTKRKNMNA